MKLSHRLVSALRRRGRWLAPLSIVAGGCATVRDLSIDAKPAGAQLTVDGKPAGALPVAALELSWGEEDVHELLIEAPGHEALPIRLTQQDADAATEPWRIDAELAPLTWTVEVAFDSSPPGALLVVGGSSPVRLPGRLPVTFRRDSSTAPWETLQVAASLADHAPSRRSISAEDVGAKPSVRFELEALAETIETEIRTTPPGATVAVDGIGTFTTPARVPLRFRRPAPDAPWSTIVASIELANHAPEELRISRDSVRRKPEFEVALVELIREVPVEIVGNVDGATVEVDDHVGGQTPYRHLFRFSRAGADSDWSTSFVVVKKDGYRWSNPSVATVAGDNPPFCRTLRLDEAMEGRLAVRLEPIRFVRTPVHRWRTNGRGLEEEVEIVLSQVEGIGTEPKVQAVTRITDGKPDEPFMESRISVVPGSEQILFSSPISDRTGGQAPYCNLWMRKGSQQTQLTNARQRDLEACVSPDGKWVYFASDRLGQGRLNIWRVPTVGRGGLTKITDSPSSQADTEPSVSADGKRLAYTSYLRDSMTPYIWVANSDGTLPTQIREGRSATFSPDGTRLVFVAPDLAGREKIWVMDADGSNPTMLTQGDQRDLHPIWSPTGDRIIFASDSARNEAQQRNFDIWMMSADGGDPTQLTVDGSEDARPAMSPNGRYIYFTSNRGALAEGQETLQIWRLELPQ